MTHPMPQSPITLRALAPGDLGWVVQQHGEVYAREYGWNEQFEALVADIAVRFVRKFQPEWENCWIAEQGGERLGLGARLTDECIAFARAKGYKKMVLWTNSCLTTARHIYARRGFVLVKSEPYEGFGQHLVGETWELKL